MKTRLVNKTLFTCVLALLAGVFAANAGIVTLLRTSDASGTSSFTGSTNWNPTGIPAAANDYYTGANFLRSPADGVSYTFGGGSLTLQTPTGQATPMRSFLYKGSGGNVYTINNFTNSGGVIDSGAGNVAAPTFAGNIFYIAANSAVNPDQGPFIISAPLAGPGNLTNNGSFALTFNGTNSAFTGKLVVGGTATNIFNSVSNVPGNPSVFTPDQLTLGAGTTFRDNVGVTLNNPNGGITLAGNASINAFNATTNTIIAEPITGAFTLTKSGGGTLTLSGSNTMTAMTLSGATAGSKLNINGTNALGTGTFTINGGSATIDNTSGSPLTNFANNAQSWGNDFTFAGSTNLNLGTGTATLAANRVVTVSANTLTIGGIITGAFTLTSSGAGTLLLAGAGSTYTGTTTIGVSQGAAVLRAAATQALSTNTIIFDAAGNASTARLELAGGISLNNAITFSGRTSSGVGIENISGNNSLSGTVSASTGGNIYPIQSDSGLLTLSGAPAISAVSAVRVVTLQGAGNGQVTGTITNGAGTIGITKSGAGTWTLGGVNTYSGNTTVGGGTLALGAGASIGYSSNILVASGATFDVSASGFTLGATNTLSGSGTVNGSMSDSTGSQIFPGGSSTIGTLTFNNNLTLAGGDTLQFDLSASSNDVMVVGGSLTPNGTVTVNLANGANALPNGGYVLFLVTNNLNGSAANFAITGQPSPSRQSFTIVYNTAASPKQVLLQVSGSPANLVWQGGLNGNLWDIITTYNWTNSSILNSDVYFDGDNVNFTDYGSANQPVLNTNVHPGSLTFNSANAYTLSGNGSVSGSAGLTKTNTGTLTIQTTNSYTGVTALNGGTVSIATITNSGFASPIGAASSAAANLAFNGGTLQYTTGDTPGTDHGVTLNAGGGTVQVTSAAGVLSLNGAIVGGSGGGLTKSGNGTLVLNAANTYNGSTTISGGTLQVGNGGATGNLGSGSTIADNTALVVNRTGTLTLTNVITGSGSIANNGTGTLVLAGTNTYSGGTIINTGLVQVVTASGLGSTPAVFNPGQLTIVGGELEASTSFNISDTNSGVSIVAAGTIGVDSGMTLAISNQVVSAVSLTKALPGTLILSGSNTFSGVLNVDTASQTASDGALRIASTNALGGVPTINIRNNQIAASSTLQLDGTGGGIVITQTLTWSGRNNLVPAIESLTGSNTFNPASVTFVVGGTDYPITCDAGTLNLPGTFPTTVPATGRTIVLGGNGLISLTGTIQNGAGGGAIGLLTTNNGTVFVSGNNSYTGLTSLQGGTMSLADGSSIGVQTTNIELAPLSGETATLNISNATVNAQRIVIAGITANNTAPGIATVNQMNGTVYASQWVTVGSGGTAGGTGTYNLGGSASLNVQNTAGGTQLEIANFIGSTGTLNLSGSATLNIENNAFISMGANASAGNGTVNQTGGTVTFYSDSGGTIGGTGILYLGKATGLTSNYTYNLDGGTLIVPTITSASGNSLFYLNGGTLQAAKTNAAFLSGLTAAYVSTNGATIDDGGFVATIAQPLVHDPALGAGADGGLKKQDSGTLILNGTNTYTGPTTVSSGALWINSSNGAGATVVSGGSLGGGGTLNGSVDVQSGAALAPGAAIGVLTVNNSLSFESGSAAQFNFGTGTNSTAVVTGAVNVNGATTISISYISAVAAVGTYPLIQYGSLTGFGNLTPPASPNPRFTFSLVNNTSAHTIELVVAGNPASLVWVGDGINNYWDNAGSYENWTNTGTHSLDYFYDGDSVLFNNSGSSTPSIYLTATVSPASVTVNANQNYDFAGSGLIAGPGNLTKSGSGTLTLEDDNTYIGATVINGGALQVGNGSSTGSLGSGAVTNNASLVMDRSDAVVLPSPIYGSGTVTLALGNITASSSNYYTGATLINSGITLLQNSAGLGATNGGITVASSAQLYINLNVDVGANPLTLTGTGDGNGALRKGGAGTTTYYGTVALNGDTTIGVDGGATLNLASTNGINGVAANANLTLAGTGAGSISGPITLGGGGLTLAAGTWLVAPSNNFTGLTALNAGTLRITGGSLGNPATFTANQITLGGALLETVSNSVFNDGNAGFTLTANSTLMVDAGATLTISNTISGGNNLTKSSPGTLVLDGNNAFSGTLFVDTGSTTANDGITHIASPNALANVPVTPGTATIQERDNNGGFSILQLDAVAGNLTVPQEISLDCRNTANANIENLNGSNTLSGNIDVQTGGGAVYLQSDSGTLNLAGSVQYIGTLNGTRTYTFTGAGNHLVTGVITAPVNTNAPINVAMNGAGTLTLANANTYPNTTTVNSGLLLVNGSINSTGGVSVVGGTLGGNGAISDTVSVSAGGTLSPGAAGIGTLTINSNLTLAGTTYIEVNKSTSASDQVLVLTTVNYGGTLFATNLSGTLNLGDNFTVFSTPAHTGNFAAITGSPGVGKAWSFNPTNGVLSVVTGIASNPTNLTATVSGRTLTLTWPSDHVGWILQAQTNSLSAGLGANWFDVAGSAAGNTNVITINPASPTVFFRLRHP
jgi:fibronectin-binding autotransporter adhesin